jgi:RNA polymerase sigma-70 factor (ECF subfamily)
MRSQERDKLASFEQSVLPHLGAAYNLARWLTRNEHDAEDVVQEAYMRAFKFFGGFRGGDSRSWLLTIVRNTCYTWMHQNRSRDLTTVLDEEVHALDSEVLDPEALLLEKVSSEVLKRALDELPIEFREAVVLRELEEMSYKEIADISSVPVGTVMSRLARGRKRLQQVLTGGKGKKETASPGPDHRQGRQVMRGQGA